jgi:hypothetical protein
MGLFARKIEAAPVAPAPAKRIRKGITYGELADAIDVACAGIDPVSTTSRTLNRLASHFDCGMTDNGLVVQFVGPAPVSCAELDAALAEMQDLPPSTLSLLKRVHLLLAEAEEKAAKVVGEAVTRADLEGAIDAFGWAIGAMADELNRGQPSRAHLFDLLGRSASTPARKKLLASASEFREADAPKRSQAEWLRYNSTGRWS